MKLYDSVVSSFEWEIGFCSSGAQVEVAREIWAATQTFKCF